MADRSVIPPGLAGVLNDGPPVTPVAAGSVLLLDVAASPWRVLMMRRPGGARFAPDVYVFPGGTVHASEDGDVHAADPVRAAAVRELFEEVGILLARDAGGRFARDRECGRLRDLLSAGTGIGWTAALAELGLVPALDRITFLARWITPEPVARRYDTRFYLARRPPGQTVHPQPGEVAAWCWTTVEAALAPEGLPLVHATRRILESLAAEPDAGRLIARMRRRRESAPVLPRLVPRADGGFDIVDDGA